MTPPKENWEKEFDEKATNDWCVCFIPDGLGEETNLYLAESFCDEEIKSFIRSHFISREKVEKVIERINSRYFLDKEETKIWKKVFGAVSQKEEEFVNERIRQALLYVSQELLE